MDGKNNNSKHVCYVIYKYYFNVLLGFLQKDFLRIFVKPNIKQLIKFEVLKADVKYYRKTHNRRLY